MFPLLVLGGPTGSGKNKTALSLASDFPIEIINADSRQIYRDLVIGSNQPSHDELTLVPHHLFAFLSPREPFSAPQYEAIALPIVSAIRDRGHLPVVVGGTGFYIKALLKGSWNIPRKDPALRSRLHDIGESRGPEYLHRMLHRIDPASASKISINDTYRVTRALEIFFQSGKKKSELDSPSRDRMSAAKFYLDPHRPALSNAIRNRTAQMFRDGWIDETRLLLERFPDFESLPAAAAFGYREILRHLRGELTLDECMEIIILKTTQYAKRQLTWFRNQDGFVPIRDDLHKLKDSVIKLTG